MNKGQIISGLGHLGLVTFALVGGLFTRDHEAVPIGQATVISESEYAAMIQQYQAPQASDTIEAPPIPEAEQEEPAALGGAADQVPSQTRPPARPEPEAENVPETIPEPLPKQPAAELIEELPEPVTPEPQEDVAVLLPDQSVRPKPRPSRRIAPEPVQPPEPDAKPDDVAQTATEQTEEPAEVVEPEQEETAPEEAATEIVTEAEETDEITSPSSSVRPKTRPKRPDPAIETATANSESDSESASKPAQTDTAAVDAALAEALGQNTGSDSAGSGSSKAPSGPPMTAGEKDGLRVAVQRCWNVGSLSSDALATTVTVTVDMTEDGKPVTGSIRMLDFSGGSDASARQAFEAARRAIIRCGAKGFDLPREKYAHWREIEMTFNPEKMRIK